MNEDDIRNIVDEEIAKSQIDVNQRKSGDTPLRAFDLVNKLYADTHLSGTTISSVAATNGQVLAWNGTQWAPGNVSELLFGDGSDGALSTSGNVSLSRDMYYTTLTVNNGHTVSPNGFKLYASTSITVNSGGGISVSGGAGGTGGDGQTVSGDAGNGTGGTAGTAGAGVPTGTIKQPGNGPAGKTGANAPGVDGTVGGNGSSDTNCIQSNNAATGGIGGQAFRNPGKGGASAAGTSGTATQTTKVRQVFDAVSLVNANGGIGANPVGGSGGSGASPTRASSNDGCAGGGGSGGAGAPGGIALLCSPTITVNAGGSILANGGRGGNGGNGGSASGSSAGNNPGAGGGAGSPGNGGVIILVYETYTNNGTVQALAGGASTGGAAGTGSIGREADPGGDSTSASAGTIIQLQVSNIT